MLYGKHVLFLVEVEERETTRTEITAMILRDENSVMDAFADLIR